MGYLGEHRYDDIITMSHHVSVSGPKMSMLERAVQVNKAGPKEDNSNCISPVGMCSDFFFFLKT